MNKNIKNIIKEKIVSVNINKKEILWNVKKSIKQNNNINNNIKMYMNYNMDAVKKKNNKESKRHKICLLTGKRSSVLKNFSFSRYVLKNFILSNKLVNFKIKNW